MITLELLCVGRLKTRFWQDAASHYRKRMKAHYRLNETEVKDGPGKLPPAERNRVEGESLLAKLGPDRLAICLDEGGKTFTSRELAAYLEDRSLDRSRIPCFVIGGPFGLSETLRARADLTLSLGPMTFPHEMARVILLEQLYRAASILKGLPYHHD